MERSRDAMRGSMVAARRRHRNHSLRDSSEMDAAVELPETSRLRYRDRSGNRERDRMITSRNSDNKRRRAERLSNYDSSEESVNDEEDEDEYYHGGGGTIRMLPPSTTSMSSALNHHHNHRKSFPPLSPVVNNKHFRPVTAAGLKLADEMIGVSIPRRARSASAKRSHEWPSSCGVVGEQFQRQASTSPLRPAVKSPSPAPTSSPSSSHVSIKKKPRPNGPKLKHPSKMAKSLPSAQDVIEIEIAEVLYEMMRQPQGPATKIETKTITATTKSTSDAKSRASSPISSSACAPPPHSASAFPQNSSFSATSMSASAPKRKRPRGKHEEESPPMKIEVSTTSKTVMDHVYMKIEVPSSNLEKKSAENGVFSFNLSNSSSFLAAESRPESKKDSKKPESKRMPDLKTGNNDESTGHNLKSRKEEAQSPRLDDNKANSTKNESHREDKFQIDLMAPPPYRSSPEREGDIDFMSADPKPTVTVAPQTEVLKSMLTKEVDEEKDPANLEGEESNKKGASYSEEAEFKKPVVGSKERSIDLQLDLARSDRNSGNVGFSGRNNVPQHCGGAKQQQSTEKTTLQPSSAPLPISMPMPLGWPGGISPMGYMAPLQGIVSMDGSAVPPAAMQPPQVLFNQPRPKRCATHCYIARNIYYHQQMSKMNPFWPMAAGSGSMYGAKHNPSVVPPEFHGTLPSRGANSASDKGQGIAMFPAQPGKEKTSSTANLMDAQRKQLVMQQTLPPGAPSNILHGPAFIFPMSQQQAAAAAASVRPGSVKSPGAGSAALPSILNTPSITASVTPAVSPAMSFNYPGNEPQYLAIMPNNAYPFSMPAHVGAPPTYRGPHAQTLPYFNGSYYSGQMVHPSQFKQQQQPPCQSQQNQQGHQNPSISTGSSSSQKHLQNQQLRPPTSGMNGVNGLQGFPPSKSQPSQTLQMQQQRQKQQNTHAPHQARQHEHEKGGEDSPSTADSRISHPNIGIYPQNFTMAMPPPNFSLLTPAVGSSNGATAVSGSEKKQQQGSKTGVEGSPAYAVSFALNGAKPATGFDMASLAHSQAIFQSLPEATKQGYQQIMAAAFQAQAAQHKKNYRHPEEMKGVIGDSSNVEEERKAMTGKASTVGHSIAFSADGSTSTIPGNNVLDSSAARSLNLSSAPGRASSSIIPVSAGAVNAPTPQQQFEQHLRNHQQQQQLHQMQQHQIQQQQHQMLQLQKQQLQQNAVRSKTPATSNGSTYSDHLPSTSSMAAKFPNALSSFPQNLVQTTTSPFQSPQLKNSSRTSTSQAPATSLASSTSSSLKKHPLKQGRTQQSHTQISFAANPKSSSQNQGLQSNNNQSLSPPIMVCSPTTTTSSMSKSAGGSPRTNTSNSAGNKASQASSLSSQHVKNSPSVPSQKSFTVAGRNAPSSTGIKSQSTQVHQQQQQQKQQQQVSKQSIQQPQLYFSSAYMDNQQASHPSSTGGSASPSSGYYVPARRRSDVQQQPQHSQGSSGTSAAGMLSLSPPVTLANNTGTTDPAKAVAAAAAHMKGGGHHAQFATAQSSGPHQLVP